jgi:hypothetical protein
MIFLLYALFNNSHSFLTSLPIVLFFLSLNSVVIVLFVDSIHSLEHNVSRRTIVTRRRSLGSLPN